MTHDSSQSLVLAFAASAPLALTTDLSGLQPIPVQWIYDLKEMLNVASVVNPASMVVVGDEDNIASLRTCYALRQSCVAPLHLITATMSESEGNLALSLGVTTVNTPTAGPTAISKFVKQTVRASVGSESADLSRIIEIGGMQLDLGRRRVGVDGQLISLTRTEFDLLALLVRAAGSVVSRADLVAKVWGANWFGVENVLDTHLAHLRRKLSEIGFYRSIVNVRGVGFYFESMTVERNAGARRESRMEIS